MDGTELTCGCYKTKEKSVVFPLTEVVTHNEFFDYDAKYNGQVDEITPARISEELTRRVQTLTSAIYDILGCSGIIRVDYIITEGEKINLLEVNTTPGMQNIVGEEYFPNHPERADSCNTVISIVDRTPKRNSRMLSHTYAMSIYAAQHDVRIVNPYFVPTSSIRKALKRALYCSW